MWITRSTWLSPHGRGKGPMGRRGQRMGRGSSIIRLHYRGGRNTESKGSSHKMHPSATSCSTQKQVGPAMPTDRQWVGEVCLPFSIRQQVGYVDLELALQVQVISPASLPSCLLPLLYTSLPPSLSCSFPSFFPPSIPTFLFSFLPPSLPFLLPFLPSFLPHPSLPFFLPSCSLLL